jgi:hypothetical protein
MELISLIIFVAIVWIATALWIYAVKDRLGLPPYQDPICTGDCEQGRRCTCGPTEECAKIDEHWPFPRPRP